jgi:hypothetical protein
MITFLALLAFFLFIAFERFGVTTKYNDLFVGVAALIVAVTLILGRSTGL